jgi:hypothetical protein
MLSTEMMFKGFTKAQMVEPLTKYLHDLGYSTRFIASTMEAHFDNFGKDIDYFRANMHLFSPKDIELELNISESNRNKMISYANMAIEGKISPDQYGQLLKVKMKNMGYSNNYIKFTVVKSLSRVADIHEQMLAEQQNQDEESSE